MDNYPPESIEKRFILIRPYKGDDLLLVRENKVGIMQLTANSGSDVQDLAEDFMADANVGSDIYLDIIDTWGGTCRALLVRST